MTQSRRVLRQGFRNLRQAIGGLVSDGREEGLFGKVDPDLAALVILGGIRMAAHAQIGAHELADTMSDLFIHGLRSGGEPSRRPVPALTSGAVAARPPMHPDSDIGDAGGRRERRAVLERTGDKCADQAGRRRIA